MTIGWCGWGSVGGGLSVGGSWGLAVGVVLSLALVLHGGHVAAVPVDSVGDLLHAAVGQQHVVAALGVVAVAGLVLAEVKSGIVVLHGPVEGVFGFLLEERWREKYWESCFCC